MKIYKIVLKNFKNFSKKDFKFNDLNLISGKNGEGKTTIKEAILFAFYNKNSLGSATDTSKFIKNGKHSCCVEIFFEIDGSDYHLKRTRSERTNTVKLIDGSQSEEDSIVSQRDLNSILPEYELFQNVFNVGFFMRLPDKNKREFFLKHTKPIDKKELFKKMTLDDYERLMKEFDIRFDKSLEENHKDFLQERKDFKEELTYNSAIIDDSEPIKQIKFDEERYKKLKSQNDKLVAYKKKLRQSVKEWEEYNYKKRLNEEISKDNDIIVNKIKKIVVKNIKEPTTDKIDLLLSKKNEIKGKINLPKETCPVCFQKISSDHKDQIDKINNKNIRVQRELEQKIEIERDIYNKKLLEYSDNQAKKEELKSLESKIRDLFKVVEPKQKMAFKIKGEEKLKQDLIDIEIEKNESEKSIESEKERQVKINKLVQANKKIIKRISDLNTLINLFSPSGIRAEEMRLKLEPIIKLFNEYLPNSKIKTLRLLKNKLSCKEVFEVYQDNKEYSKMSLGERTRVDIAISKIIDKISGNKINLYFIDNSEILDTLPKVIKQSFIAKVTNKKLNIKKI